MLLSFDFAGSNTVKAGQSFPGSGDRDPTRLRRGRCVRPLPLGEFLALNMGHPVSPEPQLLSVHVWPNMQSVLVNCEHFLSVSASAPGVAKGVKKAGTSLTSTRGLQQAGEDASFRSYPSPSVSLFLYLGGDGHCSHWMKTFHQLHNILATLLTNFDQTRANTWEYELTVNARISVHGVASIESR